jgi:hypothetical protein
MRAALLILLFAALPLGTSALEVTTGLALAGALWIGRGRLSESGDLLIPAALIGIALQVASPGVAALGKLWPLALVLAVPVLADTEHRERAVQCGLVSAALVGVGSVLTAVSWPALGPFSHHLTLGYALVPPLAVAVHRRSWVCAAGIGAGILASASSGPVLSAGLVIATLWWSPATALLGGAGVSLALISALSHQPALAERAVLWSAGAMVAVEHPVGAGVTSVRAAMVAAQDHLSPGFYFPYHAHDFALQAAAMSGMAIWIGLVWLLWSLWQRTDIGGRAALVGVLVGGMTQDTLGDLEVIRALCAWTLIAVQPGGRGVVRGYEDIKSPERSPT